MLKEDNNETNDNSITPHTQENLKNIFVNQIPDESAMPKNSTPAPIKLSSQCLLEGSDIMELSFGHESNKTFNNKNDRKNSNNGNDASSIDIKISVHSPINCGLNIEQGLGFNEIASMSEIKDKQDISEYKELKHAMNKDDQMISRKSLASQISDFGDARKSLNHYSGIDDGRKSVSCISDN